MGSDYYRIVSQLYLHSDAKFLFVYVDVDRTGDIQTVALAVSFIHPGFTFDTRAERWIQTYRKLLDLWKFFNFRAKFDVARGTRMRSAQAVVKAVGGKIEDYDFAPAKIFVRCNCECSLISSFANNFDIPYDTVCNTTISPITTSNPSTKNVNAKRKITSCPNCHKNFPKCCICLMSIGVVDASSPGEPALAWCWCQ